MVEVLGQEVWGGDEYRAGQAGVGVRAALLERQSAVPVGQGHSDPAQVLFHPCRVVESVVLVGADGFAPDVDFRCLFPVPSDGFILEPCVAGGHLVGFMVQQPADHFLWDVSVDEPCRVGVAELMGGEAERVALFIMQPDPCLPGLDVAGGGSGVPRPVASSGVRGGGKVAGFGMMARTASACWVIAAASSSSIGKVASRDILWLN
jgi:hypothetical protein